MIRHYCELRVANHVGRLHQVDAPFSFSKYSSAIHNRKAIKTYRIGSLGNIKATIHRPQLQNTPRTRSFCTFPVLQEFLSKSEQKSDELRLDNNQHAQDHLLIQLST